MTFKTKATVVKEYFKIGPKTFIIKILFKLCQEEF